MNSFLCNFYQSSFQCGISHKCTMGSTYWAIAADTNSDIVTLYLKHFSQSHSCIHIKEGYICVQIMIVINVSNNEA